MAVNERIGSFASRYLDDVFVGRLALHEGGDVGDGAIHLDGHHLDGDGHGATGQDGRVDDLRVLWGGGGEGDQSEELLREPASPLNKPGSKSSQQTLCQHTLMLIGLAAVTDR